MGHLNFETIDEENATGDQIMENLYNSIRNMRKNAPSSNKPLASKMRKTSLHADLEFKRRIIFSIPSYNTGMNSPFANTIIDYIDMLF